MKVNFSKNMTFSRLLRKDEIAEYQKTLLEAKEKIGQTGKSILIMPDIALPQKDRNNTGVGNLASKEASDFFDFMKVYLGINTVEILPHGEVNNKKGCFNIYSGSSLSISDSRINLKLLTTEDFGNILSEQDVDEAVSLNNFPGKDKLVNFENVLLPSGGVQKALRKAFGNFEKLNDDSKIKQEFLTYKTENNDRLFRKAIFKILEHKHQDYQFENWNDEIDKNLYNNDFDKELRSARLKEILSDENNKKNIDFYFFKQFLAEKHLEIGKKMLNDKGLKLYGDVLVGFSFDEHWANPEAFTKNAYMGSPFWHLPALKIPDLKDVNSPASQILKKKFQFFAKHYDGLRVDCGWSYVNPAIFYYKENNRQEWFDFKGELLDRIEGWVQDIKGRDFDKKDIVYEFDADPLIFQLINNNGINPVIRNRIAVFNSSYMDTSWGTNQSFLNKGFKPDEYCLGVGNHDPQPLRQIAYNIPNVVGDNEYVYTKNKQIRPLSDSLYIDGKTLEKPTEFIKAKFADPMQAKNNHVFFMDVFGRDERYDNIHPRNWLVYRQKLSKDYKKDYETALKTQHGFNIMDAIFKIFRKKGLDEKEVDLYNKIKKFRRILYE